MYLYTQRLDAKGEWLDFAKDAPHRRQVVPAPRRPLRSVPLSTVAEAFMKLWSETSERFSPRRIAPKPKARTTSMSDSRNPAAVVQPVNPSS